ncbi:universal stress protein [Streptomyces sp. WAC04114]|nr:universal stress protein [Streptomyces sp. WAC04114]
MVVGVDGSAEGLAAAHWAAREAQRRGTGLSVIHVWRHHPRPAPCIPIDSTERDWHEQALHEAVRSLGRRWRCGGRSSRRVRSGRAPRTVALPQGRSSGVYGLEAVPGRTRSFHGGHLF